MSLAARWISSPLPYQLGLALQDTAIKYTACTHHHGGAVGKIAGMSSFILVVLSACVNTSFMGPRRTSPVSARPASSVISQFRKPMSSPVERDIGALTGHLWSVTPMCPERDKRAAGMIRRWVSKRLHHGSPFALHSLAP